MLQLHSVKIKVKGSDIQVDSLAKPIETKCDYLIKFDSGQSAIADFDGEYWNGIYPMGAYPQPPRPTAVVTSAFKLSAMPSLAQTGS
jgi:hypothetical protein